MAVLTNDDGIDEPGLAAIERAVEGLVRPVVVAPTGAQSMCSHALTTGRPITIETRAAERFAVSGSPADCVRLALHHLVPGMSWVFSGINAGGNLGSDVLHSGTVAAVREAALRGLPGAAFSQVLGRGIPLDWSRAERWCRRVLEILLARQTPIGSFWNVNLPPLAAGAAEPPIQFCRVDPSPLPLDFAVEPGQARYTGDYYKRERHAGHDVDRCFHGAITVSLLRCFDPGDEGDALLGDVERIAQTNS